MKKYAKNILFIVVLLFGTLVLQNCQMNYEDEIINNSNETHFVSIIEIETIIKNKAFYRFIQNFKTNIQPYRSSNSDSIYIVEYREIKDISNTIALYLTKLSDKSLVVFAADDRSHPVLSISEFDQEISIDSVPPSFVFWLHDEAAAIKFAKDNNLSQTVDINNEWEAMRIHDDNVNTPWECNNAYNNQVGPIVTTNWGQGVTYNELCPSLGCSQPTNGHAWSGCVATAMAQIMRYHQHPSNYNWTNMPANSGTYDTQLLMRDVGNTVNMDYGCDGSGASQGSIVQAFLNDFNYSYATFGDYNYQTVKSNINQNNPVLLLGDRLTNDGWWFFDEYSGHAWVTDGYREGYYCLFDDEGNVTGGVGYLFFHMNWGWGANGSLNNWCGLNNFTTPNGYAYNYHRKMVYNITP